MKPTSMKPEIPATLARALVVPAELQAQRLKVARAGETRDRCLANLRAQTAMIAKLEQRGGRRDTGPSLEHLEAEAELSRRRDELATALRAYNSEASVCAELERVSVGCGR